MTTTLRAPNTTVDGALACAFCEPWRGPHPRCAAHSRVLCARFEADVTAGRYNTDGYTPQERAAQTRRLQAASRLF